MAAHNEIEFEKYVTKKLVENGWKEGKADKYDMQRALYPEDVVAWVQNTQPDTWDKLVKANGNKAEQVLLDRLEKQLASKTGGTMKVIREGIKIAGAGQIDMSQRAPEDDRNETVKKRYKQNILRVVRQVKYDPTREFSIDLVFFINGISVATNELKTDFTQSIEDAITQYKVDRKPVGHASGDSKRKHQLLTFKRGAVVHFAMSDSEISMCTELKGEDSFFLPFNKGNDGHAGNKAREDGEYPVAYFWEEVCQWDNWLRIFHSFVYVETKEKVDKKGKPYKSETLIFPRFHQLEAVNKMIADTKQLGPGHQYLCEHSAGSGKTSTIAWTAHDLIKLRHPDGKAMFDTVIIVTDRNVLDAQLQEAVQQLDHQYGVIETITTKGSGGSKSKKLAQALKKGTPIVVVTIQTFPFAMEAILTDGTLKDRNFGVIIDECHTSQTGSTAHGLRAALSLESKEMLEDMTVEDVLLEVQKSRVRPANISNYAFTATPKHNTMMLFGRPKDLTQPVSDENKPESFHKYTQRQAIEEGFILDVLENYTPYKSAYKIGELVEHDRRVDKKYANRALGRWKSLSPTAVSQKVEFIIKHFQKTVAPLLDGEAKAMVVTSGRPQAVKYKLAFDAYIQKHGISDIRTLVAFSGKVPGKDVGDDDEQATFGIDEEAEYTEYNLNPDIGSKDLRNAFEEQEYRVMIVANKFQTGFNQPKLVAMYLDKKISGVEAVQTLSRLNRTYPGKDTTYVIDFVNEPKTILDAFKQYDEGAEIEKVQDLDVVYEMKEILDDVGIYRKDDLDKFKDTRGKYISGGDFTESLHRKLYAATQRPTDIFNSKLKELNASIGEWDKAIDKAVKGGDSKAEKYAETKRSEFSKEREELMLFKTRLGRYVRTYGYIAQLVELYDPELENFSAFAKLLEKRLKGISAENVDLSGIFLANFQLKKLKDDSEGEKGVLKPIKANDSEANDREKETLHKLIERLNDLFGDISDDNGQRHFAVQTINTALKNPLILDQINQNTKDQALNGDLPKAVQKAVAESMKSHSSLARNLLSDPQTMEEYVNVIYDLIKMGNSNDILSR